MKPVLLISGPTASGKSDIAVRVAKELDGEIVNIDSVQIYRGLNIGSAKITAGEKQGIKKEKRGEASAHEKTRKV